MPQEKEDLLDLQVPLVSLVAQEVSVPLGQWERRASRVRKVQLVLLGEMENKGLWDYQVLQGRLVHQERTEIRGRQVDQDRKAAKETRESGVPQGHLGAKDLLDSQDQRVWMESQGPGDSKECTDLKEMKVLVVSKGQLDHQGCRECQDPLERRERVAMLELWALQDNLAHMAPRDPVGERVLRACRVEWASQEWWEKRERMEKQGIQEMWVKLAPLERKVKWVRRVILAPLGLQDPQESEAHLDQMDPKDTQVPLDFLETRDPLERLVLMVLMVGRELKGIMANLAKLDPQELQESLALPGHLDGGVM